MTIGLLSDTHGYLDDQLFTVCAPCDELWHAGDIGSVEVAERLAAFRPLRAVYGNIDGPSIRRLYGKDARFRCGEMEVWMTHIAGSPPRYTPQVRQALAQQPPDLLIAGHTHILRVVRDSSGILYLNPGAAGRYGPHLVRTLLLFEIQQGRLHNMRAVELGPR